MRDMNKIHITGRLVRDPELKYTTNGKAICTFAVAVNRGKDKQGNDYPAYFFDCKAWEKLGEIINQYCAKGNQIIIQGHIEQQRWVDKETQQKRSRVYIIADSMLKMGGWKNETGNQGGQAPAQDQQPATPPDDEVPF